MPVISFFRKNPAIALAAFTVSFILVWALAYPEIYLSAEPFLKRDNQSTNYPMFAYICEFLRFRGEFPNWVYTAQGGIWIEPLTNNYLTLLPYRWVGYALAATTRLPLPLIYKISFLWVGQGMLLTGIFLLAKALFRSSVWGWVAVLVSLTSGVTIGILHQEQVMGTVFYLPWIWWTVLQLKAKPRYWVLLGILLGLMVDHQYPHLFLLYGMALLWGAVFSPRQVVAVVVAACATLKGREGRRLFGLGTLGFLISASPFLYSALMYHDKLISAFRRQTQGLSLATYQDYLGLHAIRFTSLQWADLPLYLTGYFKDPTRYMDDKICFAGAGLALVLWLCLRTRIAFKGAQIATIGVLLFFSLGVHAEAARVLWYLLPGIEIFRQWYHLSPILLLHLVFFCLFVFKASLEDLPKSHSLVWNLIGCTILFALSLFGILPWLHGAVPALWLLAMLLPSVFNKQVWGPVVLGGFLLVGGLQWSTATASEYLEYYEATEIPFPLPAGGTDADSFTQNSLMKGFPLRSLVNPKGIDPIGVLTAFKSGGLWFSRSEGKDAVPVQGARIGFYPTGFEVELKDIPKDATALMIMQFEDGRWNLEGLPGWLKAGPGGVMQVPLKAGQTVYRVQRRASLWQTLKYLCYLPLILFCAFALKRKSPHPEAQSAGLIKTFSPA